MNVREVTIGQLYETQGPGGLVGGKQRGRCQRQLASRFVRRVLAEERGLLRRNTGVIGCRVKLSSFIVLRVAVKGMALWGCGRVKHCTHTPPPNCEPSPDHIGHQDALGGIASSTGNRICV